MTAEALVMASPTGSGCTIPWCDHSHDAAKPGDEILRHGRLFAEKQFPTRRVFIRAGWGEPLTTMRAGADGWFFNIPDPPYIRIGFIEQSDGVTHAVEVGIFDAMVLADCMRATGDKWLGETLGDIASEISDGMPEGYNR